MLLDLIPLLIPITAREARTEAMMVPNGEPRNMISPKVPRTKTITRKITTKVMSCHRLSDPNLRSSSILTLAYSSSLISNSTSSFKSSSFN